MLATFLVNSLTDSGAGSLRQAILDANDLAGPDTIQFASLSGAIRLSTGEIEITEAVTIAGPGDELLSIDAQQNSRIFNITAESGDVTIEGLTFTGGMTSGNNNDASETTHSGGAIRSITSGNLSITSSTVSGNATTGYSAGGGGIFADGNLTLTNSTVSGNRTAGDYAYGGGIQANGDVTLTASTVSGNRTTGDYAYGGGILADANVTLTNSTVSENHTLGVYASGGGIYATNGLTLTGSTLTGNYTEGENAVGGGAYAVGNVTLTNSTVSGNHTLGHYASGGGVFADNQVTLTASTVSGNRTSGDYAYGGGIFAAANITLTASTVSGNETHGYYSSGGGISALGNVTLTNSTISGNRTGGDSAAGGGIDCYGGDLMLAHSTVTGNRAEGADAFGGGVYVSDGATTVVSSIIAGNTATDDNPDLSPGAAAPVVRFSLIGDNSGTPLVPAPVGSPDNNGNLIGTVAAPISPLLGALADNGGPTMTHTLLPGSPAVDAGDPGAMAGVGDVPAFDQRGSPFNRVFDGDGTGGARIDIGAFEDQPIPLAGDYNSDGSVDAADYLVWRKTLDSSVDLRADGDGDGIIDQDDYAVWRANFGKSPPQSASASEGLTTPRPVPVRDRERGVENRISNTIVGQQQSSGDSLTTKGRISLGDTFAPRTHDRTDKVSRHAREHPLHDAARQDAALLAWLSSTPDDDKVRETCSPRFLESHQAIELTPGAMLDAVFASLVERVAIRTTIAPLMAFGR